MPRRTPFDDLSVLASASAAAKGARDLIRGGLDDATMRAVREGQTVKSALTSAQGALASGALSPPNTGFSTIDAAVAKIASAIDVDSLGNASSTSHLLETDPGIAKATKAMEAALGGSVIETDAIGATMRQLRTGSALETGFGGKRLAEPGSLLDLVPDHIGKALKEAQAASGLGSTADILARDALGLTYRQLAQLGGAVSPMDYVSPMRSVFDELGGALGPRPASLPASAPKSPPTPAARPARAAPDKTEPPRVAPAASATGTPVSVAEIGKRVRAARKAMGMTQQRFADLAGVGRRFLIELEQGKPSLEIGRVLAVCHAAGVKLGFMG